MCNVWINTAHFFILGHISHENYITSKSTLFQCCQLYLPKFFCKVIDEIKYSGWSKYKCPNLGKIAQKWLKLKTLLISMILIKKPMRKLNQTYYLNILAGFWEEPICLVVGSLLSFPASTEFHTIWIWSLGINSLSFFLDKFFNKTLILTKTLKFSIANFDKYVGWNRVLNHCKLALFAKRTQKYCK